MILYLNTSYVDIKHHMIAFGLELDDYLNTSYVDIKQKIKKFKQS